MLVCSCPQRAEEVSDPLGLELQLVARHPMGAGNETQVFGKSHQCF